MHIYVYFKENGRYITCDKTKETDNLIERLLERHKDGSLINCYEIEKVDFLKLYDIWLGSNDDKIGLFAIKNVINGKTIASGQMAINQHQANLVEQYEGIQLPAIPCLAVSTVENVGTLPPVYEIEHMIACILYHKMTNNK